MATSAAAPAATFAVTDEERARVKRSLPVLLAVFVLGVLMTQAFNLVFQNIGDALGMSQNAALLSTLPGIVLGVVCMLYGTLCDFVSPRRMMLAGVGALVAGSVLGFTLGTVNFWCAVLARMIQTAGGQVAGSVFLVLSVKYLSDKEKAVYLGIYGAIYKFAAAVGIFAGGMITSIDWRFLFLVPAVSIVFIPSLLKNVPDTGVKGASFDGVGVALFAVFAGLIAIYFSFASLALLGAAAVVAVVLALWIWKAKNPFLSRSFVTNGAYMSVVLVVFALWFFSFARTPIYNALGDLLYHTSLTEVSMWLAAVYVFSAIVGLASGPAINALGRTRTLVIACTLMVVGFCGSAVLVMKGFAVLSALGCVFSCGITIAYAPLFDIASDTLPKEEGGRGMGVLDLAMNTSSSIGISVYGSLMANAGLAQASPFGVPSGDPALISNVFLVMGIAAALSLALFLVFRKTTLRRVMARSGAEA